MYVDDEDFLEEIQEWLKENGEVFVIIDSEVMETRYLLARSYDQFLRNTQSLPGRTKVFVFRERQLPLRGIADETMLQKALQIIDEPVDFLILEMESEDYHQNEWFHGDMKWELEAKFEDFYGKLVAFGKIPPWHNVGKPEMKSTKVLFYPIPLREIRIDPQQLGLGSNEVTVDHSDQPGYQTKLGGKPDWIQADETPFALFVRRKKLLFVR